MRQGGTCDIEPPDLRILSQFAAYKIENTTRGFRTSVINKMRHLEINAKLRILVYINETNLLYELIRKLDIKEFSPCHKLRFSNPYIFAT